ncbi:MAG: S1 RNA-binding domain-containing protein, partial [Bradymonadales bacterium]|nr:S1 RNA-binding domain-containing protein [Bradymonadales bacterium]
FGAFVDVGVKQDGLVHISKLSDRFIKDPHEVVSVGQEITVRVLEVDLERKRISLTAQKEGAPSQRSARPPHSPPGADRSSQPKKKRQHEVHQQGKRRGLGQQRPNRDPDGAASGNEQPSDQERPQPVRPPREEKGRRPSPEKPLSYNPFKNLR